MRELTELEKKGLRVLRISIPEFPSSGTKRRSHPFSSGDTISLYRPAELLKRTEQKRLRTQWFEKYLVAMHQICGESVPYAFRVANGDVRSLDAGCLGFLSHLSPPEVSFRLDTNGYIVSVDLSLDLTTRYQMLLPRLLRDLDVQAASGEAPPQAAPTQERKPKGRKLKPSGYWILVSNPKDWPIDRVLEDSVDESTWDVAPHDAEYFAPGQFALLRVGADARSKAERQGRPRMDPGIYALCEVMSHAHPRPADNAVAYAHPSGWPMVDIRFVQRFSPALSLKRITAELPAVTHFLEAGREASTFPISENDFLAVIEMLGVDRSAIVSRASAATKSARETANIAEPMWGAKLYQERARKTLPILVRQAEAREPITYSDLAEELGIPNARTLNFVLGSVGQTLNELSQEWETRIPPLTHLVVSKTSGLPSDGALPFLADDPDLSSTQRYEIARADVFAYPRWREVLTALNLPFPADEQLADINQEAARLSFRSGEGEAHRALKQYVASKPQIVGLPATTNPGEMECALPSGDALDVSFRSASAWIAVEVKSVNSASPDIARGLYQCVKYAAVMRAVESGEQHGRTVRAVLVLGGSLPTALIPLRNRLAVEVIQEVTPC